MLRFLFSIKEELGDNVADMIACSTGEILLRTLSSNVTPTCSETLQRFDESLHRCIIYLLSYEALSKLTLSRLPSTMRLLGAQPLRGPPNNHDFLPDIAAATESML